MRRVMNNVWVAMLVAGLGGTALGEVRGKGTDAVAKSSIVFKVAGGASQDVSFVAGDVVRYTTENDAIILTLNDAGTKNVADLSRTGKTQVTIAGQGRTVTATATVSGNNTVMLSGLNNQDLAWLAGSFGTIPKTPVGPSLSVVTSSNAVNVGGLVTADVFVQGVSNLRIYQVAADATGGSSGKLVLENMFIDKNRADYVFVDDQVVDAVDMIGARLGAMLFDGGIEAMETYYLGTLAFRPSGDAAGTFSIQIREGGDTFLQSAGNGDVNFQVANQATVTIGKIVRAPVTR